jgi:hypothetical protein
MATTISRKGYGQVEPNHLSAQRNGKIYAQLPAHIKKGDNDAVATIAQLENGQFAKYDYANKEVNFSGDGEWLLVYNEVKVYDERDSYKDFAMINTNYVNGEIYPRLFKTDIGDIFTTNCIKTAGTGKDAISAGEDVSVGDKLKVSATGYLTVDNSVSTGMIWKVVDITTCPDAEQPAVKIQRIN